MAVASGGTVTANLTALSQGPIPLAATMEGLTSNTLTFAVDLTGDLELSADRDSLEYLAPTRTVFTLKRGGTPLPAGVQVALTPVAAGTLAGLSSGHVTGEGGKVTVETLTAMKPSGPLSVRAASGGQDSNALGFAVSLNGELRLEASTATLELGQAVRTVLTLTYGGTALPEGTAAGFGFPAGDLSGLATSVAVAAGGTVTADLTALSLGPIPLSATLGELGSNSVSFTVALSQGLELAADRDSLEFLEATGTVFTVSYRGTPLPSGTPVTLEGAESGSLGGLSGTFLTDGSGRITVPGLSALKPSGPLHVRAHSGGRASNALPFAVTLTGTLGLTASRDALGLFEARDTRLDLSYRGSPLPEGTAVSFIFNASELSGLAASTALAYGGSVSAALEALKATGPIEVSAKLGSLVSQPASFGVELKGTLSLSADRTGLGLFEARSTELALALNGKALPQGVQVGFTYADSELEGLPKSATTGPGGKVTASLASLKAVGPIEVSASAGGLASNRVSFDVDLDPGNLAMDWVLEPRYMFNPGFGMVDYGMAPCETYQGAFSFTYLGRPLAGTAILANGVALPPGGQEIMTDGTGTARFQLRYDMSHQEAYYAESSWRLRIGETELLIMGPLPDGFVPCG
jgi:hypothetical protein